MDGDNVLGAKHHHDFPNQEIYVRSANLVTEREESFTHLS